MIAEGVTIAVLAKTSCGEYAGIFETKINEEYAKLVEASLKEVIGEGNSRRGFFLKDVIIDEKPKAISLAPPDGILATLWRSGDLAVKSLWRESQE